MNCGPLIPEDTCDNDAGSTGIQLLNGQCQCLYNFYWEENAQKCYAGCKQELSIGKDPSNPQKCECKAGAYWNI